MSRLVFVVMSLLVCSPSFAIPTADVNGSQPGQVVVYNREAKASCVLSMKIQPILNGAKYENSIAVEPEMQAALQNDRVLPRCPVEVKEEVRLELTAIQSGPRTALIPLGVWGLAIGGTVYYAFCHEAEKFLDTDEFMTKGLNATLVGNLDSVTRTICYPYFSAQYAYIFISSAKANPSKTSLQESSAK